MARATYIEYLSDFAAMVNKESNKSISTSASNFEGSHQNKYKKRHRKPPPDGTVPTLSTREEKFYPGYVI